MSDKKVDNTANYAFWGVSAAGLIGAMVSFKPVAEVWVLGLTVSVVWFFAILCLTSAPMRDWVPGTLRKTAFTQIYTWLTRKTVMRVWDSVCDAADDTSDTVTFFRAALTWRLYDKALLIAVTYPILLLITQWIVWGEDARIGGLIVIPAAELWPERAAMLGAFAILIMGMVGRKLASASQYRVVRQAADWLPLIAVAVAFAFAVAVAFAVAAAAAGAVAGAFAVAVAGAFAVAVAGAGAVAGAVAVAVAVAGAGAFAVAVAGAVAGAVIYLDQRQKPVLARWLVTGFVGLSWFFAAILLDWTALPEDRRSLFLFLGVFPLINALFDVVSYAVTLTLLRRGLRAKGPFLFGVLDLAIACILFLLLGITLTVVIHGLNTLAGVPLLDLGALFAGVKSQPGDYLWLYLMLFSTILPTALHLLISLVGLQGIAPRPVRRRVANWVEAAHDNQMYAVRAALGLAFVWLFPLVFFLIVIRLGWQFLDGIAIGFMAGYFNILLWVAHVPVGAL